MEKFGNKLKIDLNPQGELEVLDGHEGEVFENISFKVFKNTKGKEIFKSSSPDRKIIILSPFSEIPEPDQPYRVVILEDTDPKNPKDGKMIATIVPEGLSPEDAKKLIIEEEQEKERIKNEAVLTQEDRERISHLIEESIEYSITDNPNHRVYDIGFNEWERESRKKEYKEMFDKEKERSKKVIELRKIIKTEGSKAVSYILELMKSPNLDSYLFSSYSQILSFAASENDSEKVIKFFSVDKIVKKTGINTKRNIIDIISRIGTTKDVDSLKKYFDKIIESKHDAYTIKSAVHSDAYNVISMLLEIKEKTTNSVDIEKIEDTIKYVKEAIYKKTGQDKFEDYEIKGQEKIKETFEDQFLDIDLKDGIDDFNIFFEMYYHGNVDPDFETAVKNLIELLNKHDVKDRIQPLIQKAFWSLTNSECSYEDHENYYIEAIHGIEKLTGISPDYNLFEKDIQTKYKDLLLSEFSDTEYVTTAEKLYEKTKIKFKIDPDVVQNKYLHVITIMDESFPHDFIETLEKVSGIKMDLSSIDSEVQKYYSDKILGSNEYESLFYSSSPFQKAEKLFEKTNIRPKINPETMKSKYVYWVENSDDYLKLIESSISMTGITSDFSGKEDVIQYQYDQIIYRIEEKNSDKTHERINALKKISGITPIFDKIRIERFCLEKIQRGKIKSVETIQELSGIVVDYKSFEKDIFHVYYDTLTHFDPYNFKETLEKVRRIQKLTKIELDLSRSDIDTISAYIVGRLRQINALSEVLLLEELIPIPELAKSILGEILISSIDSGDKELFKTAKRKMSELGLVLNTEDVARSIHPYISKDPIKILNIIKFIKTEKESDELTFSIQKAILNDPWISAFERIEKLQGVSSNADNDPWKNEFRPFLKNILGNGIVHTHSAEDAELVVSFVEIMGMNNLIEIFKIFIDCNKNKSLDKLNKNTLDFFDEFGIKTRKNDGSWRFKESLQLFNELSGKIKSLKSDLLLDKIPGGIETKLGLELFNRIKGSSQFENKTENNNVPSVIRSWKETVIRNPELAKLPEGLKETTLKVTVLKHKTEIPKDQSEQVESLLSSQEATDVYLPLKQAWVLGYQEGMDHYLYAMIDKFEQESESIKVLLSRSPEEIQGMVDSETDQKVKQALVKKQKALLNPNGRQGIQRQVDLLQKTVEKIREIYMRLTESDYVDGDYVEVLESINDLGGKISLDKEIRELSAIHMYDKVMGINHRELIDVIMDGNPGNSATVDSIYGIHKISKDYIEEHYLHYLQDSSHTEHAPFSHELLEKLNLVWQQQLDKQTGHMPITILKNKLDKALGVYSGKSSKEIPVTMVPVSGLFNIFSGDLGDSCHLHIRGEIADGKFPGLRTLVYVTNRNKQNEEIRGSCLLIQAEKLDDVPVLAVRANNPNENFVQSVNSDELVINLLKEAVETAKRMREERIKENPSLPNAKLKQAVVIPSGSRGHASTNRQSIADVYNDRFNTCKKIALKKTPETNFNGYDIHDKESYTAPLVIWEMDEEGNEHWYGDWDL